MCVIASDCVVVVVGGLFFSRPKHSDNCNSLQRFRIQFNTIQSKQFTSTKATAKTNEEDTNRGVKLILCCNLVEFDPALNATN